MANRLTSRPTLAIVILLLSMLSIGLFGVASRAAEEERGVLADLISRALSTPASRVTIGTIEGALSSDATIHDIAIQDRDGVWLKLDRARINWRRLALIQRRLEIDTLDLGTLTIYRRPIPAETPVAGEQQPLLPELPVRVEIKQFALSEMILGEPILGTPARFSVGGFGTLGAPAEGLELHVDGQRLDRPASATVRLKLVPEGQRLNLALTLDEPQGGILSRLANIPGQPAIKLNAGGDGTLDAFKATLAFDAGPEINATGTATLNRDGTTRKLALDLTARVAGLLPAAAAPVFADVTKLTGTVVFGDDSAVSIPSIQLAAAAASLDIGGTLSKDQIADLRIKAVNLSNRDGRTALADAQIDKLAFDAHVTGALASPTIEASLMARDARTPSGSVAVLDAHFRAEPNGSIAETSTQLRLSADAEASGLALTNPALAQALGPRAHIALRGTSTLKGVLDVETLALTSDTLAASYKGRASGAELQGRMDLHAPDLSRFGAVAGFDLKGAADLSATLEGTPRSNRYSAVIDGRAKSFGTGVVPFDEVFGDKLTLAGGIRLDPDGGVGFSDFRLTGPHAAVRIDGAATPALADLTAALTLPDLSKVDARLSGRGDVQAHVTGTLDAPDATATMTLLDATMMSRPVPRLVLQAIATKLRSDPEARITLDGEIDRKHATGALHVARGAAGATVIDGIDVRVGSVALAGGVTLSPEARADGQISLRAGNLDDLSPLLLQKLGGRLSADVAFVQRNGGQDATVKATGQMLSGYGASLDALKADVSVSDVTRHPVIGGAVAVDRATFDGQAITRLRLDATGRPQGSDVTVSATAAGFDLTAAARIVPADRIRLELSRFAANRGRDRIALAGPATITFADGGADIRNLALALGSGRLGIDGHAGQRLDLKAVARAIPLSVADLVSPGLGLTGTLEGDARVTGSAMTPTGDYRLHVAALAAPQTRSLGLPPIDIKASGALQGTRASLDATMSAAQAGTIRVTGTAPLGASGTIDLGVRGTLDAALANRTISVSGRRVTGALAIDGRLGGTLGKPQATGSATLSNGSFQDAVVGLRLDAIRARVVARGDTVTIEGASATTRNGGIITAGGRVRLDPAAGFPGDIKITGQHAQLVQSSLATAIVDLNLGVSGPLARSPRIAGRVDIQSLDVPVPERLPGGLQPLPGTRHLNPTVTAARRLTIDAKKKLGHGAPAPFDATLDLTIAVPGEIVVHGRGLNARLGGALKLTGTLDKPKPVGAFTLVRGRLQILTASLDFSRANLTFAGDLSPELDFLATTQAGGATIRIAITGNAGDPQFAFTSSPDLPQDEILSRLLFGAPSGQLTATQALSLAQAAAIYSGGSDALEGLRRSLGLGDASRSDNPLSNALGDRVSIGVRTGATPRETGVGVDISVFGPLKVKGAVDATGGQSVGVGAEHEW